MPLCPLCPPGVQANLSEVALKTHIAGKHVTGEKCGICQRSFKNNAALIQHLATKYHYPCAAPKCSQKFMTRSGLSTHSQSHIPPSTSNTVPVTPVTFPCTSCGAKLNSSEALQQHINATHVPKYPCPSCHQTFSSSDALDEHRSTSHPSFSCPYCSQKFTKSEDLLAHGRREHSGSSSDASGGTITSPHASSSQSHSSPKVQSCSVCKQSFSSVIALSSHLQAVHPLKAAKKVYPCPSCDRIFSKKQKLATHRTTTHPVGPVCAICRLTCPSQQALNIHVTAMHPTCTECNIGFEDGAAYAMHRRTSHPEPPRPVSPPASHSCSFCDMTFKSPQSLDDHLGTMHHFTCGICDTAFNFAQSLDDHMVTMHHFICAICDMAFNFAQSLDDHMVTMHHFTCGLCDMAFNFAQSLDDHMVTTHHFTCGMCEFACQKEEDLQEHIGSAHSCPVCHEGIFANGDLLNEHLVDHVTPYRCEICQTRYAAEEDLHQHYKDSLDDVHPSCARCNIGFQDAIEYHNHNESAHPQVACQLCDGALFEPEELPMHYLTSRNHPVCDPCQIGFSDQVEFTMHGAMEHPEAYCHLCQWLFESAEALQNHIRHFVAHPKCMDCQLRFADADAYQHHLYVVHRPRSSSSATQDLDTNHHLDNGEAVAHCEHHAHNFPDRVDPTWGFSGDPDFTYASFVPLPPSTSGYSSPLSQRVPTLSSIGSRSSSRTLSPPPISPVKDAYLDTTYAAHHFGSPEFEHSPLSNIPTVGTPLASSRNFSPFSPRPDTSAFFAPSQRVNGVNHSDQESAVSARSPETTSPVTKLPDHDISPVSSSGWSTLSGETASNNSPNQRPADPAVPMLRLQVPVTNGNSHTISLTPSDISPESAGINISANVTPDYLREAREYLAVTHPVRSSSTANGHSPGLVSPSLSSIGFTASSSRDRRREVRFDDSIMSEPMWENRSSDSSDSSFDPPVMHNRRKYGVPKRSPASRLPRFAPLRTTGRVGRNGSIRSGSGTSSLSPYHCRICQRETCEDLTTTTCGHLFCNTCITDVVIRDSRCPVCRNAVLLYCLFRIDTAC